MVRFNLYGVDAVFISTSRIIMNDSIYYYLKVEEVQVFNVCSVQDLTAIGTSSTLGLVTNNRYSFIECLIRAIVYVWVGIILKIHSKDGHRLVGNYTVPFPFSHHDS